MQSLVRIRNAKNLCKYDFILAQRSPQTDPFPSFLSQHNTRVAAGGSAYRIQCFQMWCTSNTGLATCVSTVRPIPCCLSLCPINYKHSHTHRSRLFVESLRVGLQEYLKLIGRSTKDVYRRLGLAIVLAPMSCIHQAKVY